MVPRIPYSFDEMEYQVLYIRFQLFEEYLDLFYSEYHYRPLHQWLQKVEAQNSTWINHVQLKRVSMHLLENNQILNFCPYWMEIKVFILFFSAASFERHVS